MHSWCHTLVVFFLSINRHASAEVGVIYPQEERLSTLPA